MSAESSAPGLDEAEILNGYRIVRVLAQGQLTLIVEARSTHPHLQDRPVALKLLLYRAYAGWFHRVAVITASLNHPSIVPCHEVGEASGQLYIVTSLVDGDNLLNDIAGKEARPIGEMVRIVAELAGALDYAHRSGIVHGYVHPRHTLLGQDGKVWLVGFGEYPYAELGPRVHLAPEQWDWKPEISPQTDVYGLSETACWLLTRVHPFDGIAKWNLHDAKQGGSWRRRDLPRAVARVIGKGMAPKPEERFPSAGAFAEALAAATRPKWWHLWR